MSKVILRDDLYTGNYPFYAGSGGGKSLASGGWTNGADTKYWIVNFSSYGYSSLTLSSKQYSSSQAPKDFKVQYSLDSCLTWLDIPNSSLILATDFTSGVLSDLPLPDVCDNQSSVFLRWIMTTNSAVVDSLPLASLGNSRIDDIIILSYSQFITNSGGITKDELCTTIFPNPNNGKFSIKTNIFNSELCIFNMFGEIVYSSRLNKKDFDIIDLSNNPKGIYIVKIFSGKKMYTKKIVVQ